MRRLDVGAGAMREDGWETLDKSDAYEPDHNHDITQLPWPFEDGTFAEVKCVHVLEHIDRNLLVPVMNELHRIIEDGGKLFIEAPVAPHWKAFADPTHVSFLVPQTFLYFADASMEHWRKLYGIRKWGFRPEDRIGDDFRFGLDDDCGIMQVWLVKPIA